MTMFAVSHVVITMTTYAASKSEGNDAARARRDRCCMSMRVRNWEDLAGLAVKYPEDTTPSIIYGHPLALFRLGMWEEALGVALRCMPEVGEGLIRRMKCAGGGVGEF